MPGFGGIAAIVTLSGQQRLWDLILTAESKLTEEQRADIGREIGRRLEVDYDEIARSRVMSLLSHRELSELAEAGVDIQLHTHRHRLPAEEDQIMREIADNRAIS